MTAATPAQAQSSLDAFCAGPADARARRTAAGEATTVGALAGAEPLLALPAAPYPATVIVSRTVGANAAVAFRGNCYSVPSGLAGVTVECRHRLGTGTLEICSELAACWPATGSPQPAPAPWCARPSIAPSWSG
jgi:hypothetical protein